MRPPILDQVAEAGHAVFDAGPYDLNIIGWRSSNSRAGYFDDRLCVCYRDANLTWTVKWFKCTTDPGLHWLQNPSRSAGCAVLVPGQYRGVYKLDKHRGKYEALCQRNGAVKVYRDNNKDSVLDFDPGSIEEGYFGINIHRAHADKDVAQIGKYSAGCQVIQSANDFAQLIDLCKMQINYHPTWTSFTYTLMEEE